GLWYAQIREKSTPLPNMEAEAIRIVLLADGSPDGTVNEQVGKYVENLKRQNKLESLAGWESKVEDGNTCKVTFTYKEKSILQPQVMEWRVNLAERKVEPQNDFTRRFIN